MENLVELNERELGVIEGGWWWVPYAAGVAIIGDILIGIDEGMKESRQERCQ
ncbi:MAG: class IIb bacteriocin, lactobin A/cerein 7B family [Cyclobacteriaceae bacterium]